MDEKVKNQLRHIEECISEALKKPLFSNDLEVLDIEFPPLFIVTILMYYLKEIIYQFDLHEPRCEYGSAKWSPEDCDCKYKRDILDISLFDDNIYIVLPQLLIKRMKYISSISINHEIKCIFQIKPELGMCDCKYKELLYFLSNIKITYPIEYLELRDNIT